MGYRSGQASQWRNPAAKTLRSTGRRMLDPEAVPWERAAYKIPSG
jgi:hypothetical protein